MSAEPAALPGGLLEALSAAGHAELGREALLSLLSMADLPAAWGDPDTLVSLTGAQAVEAYAGLQHALRTYFGRGARGPLLRMGRVMWDRLLETAPLRVRAEARMVRSLPVGLRRKASVELLARMLGRGTSVHTLDLDLMLVDRVSPGTSGQSEPGPVCHLTIGLIRAALEWASTPASDIVETACRAAGAPACEFKITTGVS